MKPPLLYFCSNGLGENLQASPAMRRLKRDFYVIALCRTPVNLAIHPDCYHEIIVYDHNFPLKSLYHTVARLAAANSSATTDLEPTPWTCHLDPQAEILDALVAKGLIYQQRERKGTGRPGSATREFWTRVLGPDVPMDRLEMCAAPPELQREGDYDILVSIGSAEKARRLPEAQQVMLCNQLMNLGHRVCLHTAGNRPEKLHPRCGVAVNRWNPGTMEQLKELVWGVRLVIGPDSGTNHLALAYGKKLIFLESREPYNAVVDQVYSGVSQNVVMKTPDCLANCSARRIPLKDWPQKPNRAAEPDYPRNLECYNLPEVPCLKHDAGQISCIVQYAESMLK